MEIKSHLFEIMQLCFLHAILLVQYLSVLLKPNFLKIKVCKNIWFSNAQSHITEQIMIVRWDVKWQQGS